MRHLPAPPIREIVRAAQLCGVHCLLSNHAGFVDLPVHKHPCTSNKNAWALVNRCIVCMTPLKAASKHIATMQRQLLHCTCTLVATIAVGPTSGRREAQPLQTSNKCRHICGSAVQVFSPISRLSNTVRWRCPSSDASCSWWFVHLARLRGKLAAQFPAVVAAEQGLST